ncbi:MAG: ATP-binding protein [Cyanobacteria bacterium P01_F01_bin.86]
MSFLLLSLLAVAAASFSAYILASQALEVSVLKRLEAIADIREASLDRWVEDQQNFLVSQANLADIRRAATEFIEDSNIDSGRSASREKYYYDENYEWLHQYFSSLLNNQRSVQEIFLLTYIGGEVIFSTDPAQEGNYRSSDTYFLEGKKGLFVQGVYPSPVKQRPTMTLSIPLFSLQNLPVGVLAINLNLHRMDEILQTSDSDDVDSLESYIVDQFNVFVSAKGFGREEFPRGVHTEGIDAAVQGKSGTGSYINYRDIPVIGVYNWLQNYSLALLVEVPKSEALQQARTLLGNILAVGGIAAILLSFGIYFLAKQISQPILAISKKALSIARGDLNVIVPVTTQDEVGNLAETFNQMTLKLRSSQQKLSDYNYSIEQKANELEKTIANLTKTQHQLVQAEKMSSLGQLVAGIAHEINNPVSFIYGNAKFAQKYADDLIHFSSLILQGASLPEIEAYAHEIEIDFLVEDFKKLIDSIQVGAERIQEIVKALRNYSRLDEAEQKYVQIHDGIESTLAILGHRLRANGEFAGVQIKRHYGDLPLVLCYPGPLNQVLMNLLSNAIDALQEKGGNNLPQQVAEKPNEITITTFDDGNLAIIEIADNGSGITQEIQAKVFNYLFTTKPSGQGTGMGLSISRDIIEAKHGGQLKMESSVGKGTTFQIRLPIHGKLEDVAVGRNADQGDF